MNIYDPALYAHFPFILTIYTPAYHYLVALLPQHPDNKFFTGRLVAMVFMILASLSLLLPHSPRDHVAVSILAIGCFFLVRPIVSHTVYLRNDSMALFFSALAVVCADKWSKRPWKILLVGIFCLIAVSCKQSFLAATASCFFYFLLKERKDALLFGVVSITLFTIFGIFAWFYWQNGFWFSVLVAPRNPFVWKYFVENWADMLRQPFFVFLFFLTISSLGYVVATKKWTMVTDSPFLIYLILSFLFLIGTLGKEGANVNYFFEPILASLLWLVFLTKEAFSHNTVNLLPVTLCLLGISVIFEFTFAKRSDYSFTTEQKNLMMAEYIDQVRNEVSECRLVDRKLLNLSWAGLTLEVQEDPVMNDLYLYSILWNTDVLSIKPILNKITDQYFGVIILRKDQYLKKDFKTPYDYLIGTVMTNYKLAKVGKYYYLTPRYLS